MPPSETDPLDAYVTALDEQRKNPTDEVDPKAGPPVSAEVREAALTELQGIGALAWPVDEGQWYLRAERDEDGPFIDAAYVPDPPDEK